MCDDDGNDDNGDTKMRTTVYGMVSSGFVQKFDCGFSMIFQDKTTLFCKIFKVFYTCLYKQNTLKTSLNAKHKFNAKR